MPHDDRSSVPEKAASLGTPVSAPQVANRAGADDLLSALATIDRLRGEANAAARREQLLVDELQHRVRNMLASIRSIYRQSLAVSNDDADFAHHFEGRLDAIARYTTYAGDGRTAGIEIEDMVRDELLSSQCLDGPRCIIEGPAWRLHGKQAELMGLAIHELTMNAVKFGALAQPDGTLSIEWNAGPDGLHFCWSEQSVTMAAPAPRPSGFGRQLIEQALPYQLGATTSFELRPGGVVCVIDLPADPQRQQHQLGEADEDASPVLPGEEGQS